MVPDGPATTVAAGFGPAISMLPATATSGNFAATSTVAGEADRTFGSRTSIVLSSISCEINRPEPCSTIGLDLAPNRISHNTNYIAGDEFEWNCNLEAM